MYVCIYIYIYIKWTVFVNVTTKSAQHAHARMIAIIVEKSPNSSHMYIWLEFGLFSTIIYIYISLSLNGLPGSCMLCGNISSTYTISVLRTDIKCKCFRMFHINNSVHQGFICTSLPSWTVNPTHIGWSYHSISIGIQRGGSSDTCAHNLLIQ